MPAEPLRLAVIGAGGFAGAHLKAATRLADQVRVDALASRSQGGLDRLGSRFGLARTTTDVDAVFADPDIDAVVLCTPHATHAPLALAALGRGKHVLVEKPMADSLAAGEAMVAAAVAAGRVLLVRIPFRLWTTDPSAIRALSEVWNAPHPSTTGYNVFMEFPYVDGRIFMRAKDGTVRCYDLRAENK